MADVEAETREARLKAALRENLKRRKAQARGRRSMGPAVDAGPAEDAGGRDAPDDPASAPARPARGSE